MDRRPRRSLLFWLSSVPFLVALSIGVPFLLAGTAAGGTVAFSVAGLLAFAPAVLLARPSIRRNSHSVRTCVPGILWPRSVAISSISGVEIIRNTLDWYPRGCSGVVLILTSGRHVRLPETTSMRHARAAVWRDYIAGILAAGGYHASATPHAVPTVNSEADSGGDIANPEDPVEQS